MLQKLNNQGYTFTDNGRVIVVDKYGAVKRLTNLSLTTIGSSGASTLIGSTLNVPAYTLSGLGGVPTSRTLTVNGTSYDLSADRSWSVGTVTSVAATAGTGISISGSPITGSGTLTITNTAPDQTVALTAGTGIGVSGTYPNFTITNSAPSPAGAITGSGTTNYVPKWTGSTALGNSLIFDNGTQVLVNTTTTDAVSGLVVKSLTNNERQGLRVYSNNQTAYTEIGWNGIEGSLASGDYTIKSAKSLRLITQTASGDFYIQNGSNYFSYLANGNAIIGGFTNAGFRLDVQGTFRSTLDANINGLTVGKGGGSVSTNTAVGVEAINATATGAGNVAIGYRAGRAITSGVYNVLTGFNAGILLTTGSYNYAYGMYAARNLTTGNNNVLIGYNTGQALTTQSGNVYIGHSAGDASNAAGNVGVGYWALRYATTGTENTTLGYRSGSGITTGGSNTVIGSDAGFSIAGGASNVLVGRYAGYSLTSSTNTAIGDQSLYSLTTGANNTALGYIAGRYITAGTGNITSGNSVYLGYDSRASADGNTNEIVIGYQSRGNGSNSVTLGNTSVTKTILQGNVGIGTTSPSARLHVQNGALTSTVTWNAADGVIISGTNFGGLQLQSPTGSGEGFIGFSSASIRNFGFIQYSNSTHRMSFATSTDGASSGTTKMQITQSGRLLLGTTTESTYLLDVNGTARVRESLFLLRSDAAATVEALKYTTANTIDLGNTFRVIGTNRWQNTVSSTSYIENGYTTKTFVTTNPVNGSFNSYDFSASNAYQPGIAVSYNQKLINGAMTINSTAIANFFGIDSRTTDNSASIANNVYAIYADATLGTNTSANRWAGYFLGRGYFSGNVGIGNNSIGGINAASVKLDVRGTTWFSADAYGQLEIIPTTGNGGETVIRQYTTGPRSGGNLKIRVDAYVQGGNFIVATNGNNERMRVTSSGNVLIGTTTDAGYRLDVNGSTRIGSIISETVSGYVELRTAIATALRVRNTTGRIWLEGSEINSIPTTIMTIATSALPQNYILFGGGTGSGANSTRINTNNGYGYNWGLNIGADGTRVMQIFTGGNVTFEKGVSNTSTNNSSALVTLNSTTQGFLPPRMTNAQMVAIATPAAGLVVYDTTNNKLNVYDGTNWVAVH